MTPEFTIKDLALPVSNLDLYIKHANEFHLLTQEEELALTRRFYENHDLEAARILVLAHLRYVIKIARGYLGYGLPLSELIQEGNIGLMKAVKKFNPNVGVRLVSFAIHWIKAEIHEFIIKNWRIVKIATTKAQRKLFFNLRSYKDKLGWLNKKEVNDIAESLSVPDSEVTHMESRLSSPDVSFDTPADENEENDYTPENYLAHTSLEPSYILEKHQKEVMEKYILEVAIKKLDHRSQDIIKNRWLDDNRNTLEELASKHNISAERVRQIELDAIKQLKTLAH